MIPSGYVLYEEESDYIVVGAVNFLLMFEDSPATIEHKDKIYKRELIQATPTALIGNVCSMRKYVLK